jgi:hypothetical protein
VGQEATRKRRLPRWIVSVEMFFSKQLLKIQQRQYNFRRVRGK